MRYDAPCVAHTAMGTHLPALGIEPGTLMRLSEEPAKHYRAKTGLGQVPMHPACEWHPHRAHVLSSHIESKGGVRAEDRRSARYKDATLLDTRILTVCNLWGAPVFNLLACPAHQRKLERLGVGRDPGMTCLNLKRFQVSVLIPNPMK